MVLKLNDAFQRYVFKDHDLFVRNFDAGSYVENFFIAAVAAVFGIRIYLHSTGYPQLAVGSIHIAHMLWGGFFMLSALILLFTYLNKEVKTLASVLGGIGFGTFIDELGKFITRDNDYFYQPSIAIMYIIFVCLFLIVRALDEHISATKYEYGVNAVELIKEIVLYDLDIEEKNKAIAYLNKADRRNKIIQTLLTTLESTHIQSDVKHGFISTIKLKMYHAYSKIVKNSLFARTVGSIFILYSVIGFVFSLVRFQRMTSIAEWGLFLSTALSSLLIVYGIVFFFRRNRIRAYHNFRRGLLVSILLTQFFAFYIEQFSAVIGLMITITMYVAVQYLSDQEKFRIQASMKT